MKTLLRIMVASLARACLSARRFVPACADVVFEAWAGH